jgi:hypothetical protein
MCLILIYGLMNSGHMKIVSAVEVECTARISFRKGLPVGLHHRGSLLARLEHFLFKFDTSPPILLANEPVRIETSGSFA